MRKNLFLGTVVLCVLLSCGEDRNDENNEQMTIGQKTIGTWTIVKKESNGTNITATLPCPNLGNFVFDSNNKLYENHSSVVKSNCITDTDNYTFAVDENSKKITTKNAQNDLLVYTISSLSDKELILLNTEGNDTTKYTFSK